MSTIPAPNWKDYTSIANWFNQSRDLFLNENGHYPNGVILPQEVWDSVSKNHFITIPGTNYFFGVKVKIGTLPQVYHTDDNQYET
jgi:hypothetical protein